MAVQMRTRALQALGQSLWLDYMRRGLLTGELQRLIAEECVTGVTANPTIFEKAIVEHEDYDAALRLLAQDPAHGPNELYERLALSDIQRTADILRSVYERTDGRDGYVSIEVSPELADDTEGTLVEVGRFWRQLERPNILIKIPGTPAGVPAIRAALSEGINVNVTLLFSVAQYAAVANAYQEALEARLGAGKPIDRIASVASFFVSRVDVLVDQLIDEAVSQQRPQAGRLAELRSRIGIANSKLAYQKYLELVGADRWKALAAKGARPQRVLWASTSTKDPKASDVRYVEALAGPDTVDTMPPETLAAFADHGQARPQLIEDVDAAREEVTRLEACGIQLDAVCARLQREGVEKFTKSIVSLRESLGKKAAALRQEAAKEKRPAPGATDFALGALEPQVEGRLRELGEARFVERLWKRDAALWKGVPKQQAALRSRLGWLDVAEKMLGELPRLEAFTKELRDEGFTHAVLLGMGGASLAAAVFRQTFGTRRGFLDVHVMDSTAPEAIRAVEKGLDLRRTLFLVASKSGGTVETLSFFRHFHARVADKVGPARAMAHFAAITDPGSGLERLARDYGFRELFLNPSDIGGRDSGLSLFGLVPAALGGVALGDLLGRALAMARACGPSTDPAANPGLRLGAALGEAALSHRDKVTLVVPSAVAAFGAWAEQLLAESTGKEGKGLVPIDQEPPRKNGCGEDRCFASLELGRKARKGLPGPAVTLHLADPLDLGAEFFRWELAGSAASALLGVDPFDEPDVQESKDATARFLSRLSRREPPPPPSFSEAGIDCWAAADLPRADLAELLGAFFAQVPARGYVALQAYLAPAGELWEALQALRASLRDRLGVATTLAYGPTFLHSTGQLHKGGPPIGTFVQIVADHPADLAIPGVPYSFGQLIGAQADGDLEALRRRTSRVLRVKVGKDAVGALERLRKTCEKALKTAAHPV
ncbi:MAG TPA: bifunctional transaldolase/phosoglucose isomerase [Myxococcales bacterium]|nr:bifunctional transaldolase/phosoglucose isomerase [Myxococcales bacterium]